MRAVLWAVMPQPMGVSARKGIPTTNTSHLCFFFISYAKQYLLNELQVVFMRLRELHFVGSRVGFWAGGGQWGMRVCAWGSGADQKRLGLGRRIFIWPDFRRQKFGGVRAKWTTDGSVSRPHLDLGAKRSKKWLQNGPKSLKTAQKRCFWRFGAAAAAFPWVGRVGPTRRDFPIPATWAKSPYHASIWGEKVEKMAPKRSEIVKNG
ncbi:MAG: hypothetical protein EOM72_09380, partial [Opitutae bacterium]|nr:hypothetical protein [Opitutae bacterium]